MKFEKLNENKIRITLNNQDLIEKNIDFNSFMSNSVEAQNLFIDMLAEAEEKVGFITRDYKIKIEALAMEDGDFVVTITRFGKKDNIDSYSGTKGKKITAKRKSIDLNADNLVYSFNTFDDFCLFSSYISKIKNYTTIAKSTILYEYNSVYYLLFSKLNIEHPYIKNFYTLITEFGKYVNNSNLFAHKLYEQGKVVIKNNAIKTCSFYFQP